PGRTLSATTPLDLRYQTGTSAKRGNARESTGATGVGGCAARPIASGHPTGAARAYSHRAYPHGAHCKRLTHHRHHQGTRQPHDLTWRAPVRYRNRASSHRCKGRLEVGLEILNLFQTDVQAHKPPLIVDARTLEIRIAHRETRHATPTEPDPKQRQRIHKR